MLFYYNRLALLAVAESNCISVVYYLRMRNEKIAKHNLRQVIAIDFVVYRLRRVMKKYWWTHPIISVRNKEGLFDTLHSKLGKCPDKLFELYRMSENLFDILLQVLSERIKTALKKQIKNTRTQSNHYSKEAVHNCLLAASEAKGWQ